MKLTMLGRPVNVWWFSQGFLGVIFISRMFGPARFISVEGGEGAGKSVFTSGFAKMLRAFGTTVVTTREPGGTAVADQIRAIFAAPPPGEALIPTTEALLVSAARSQHLHYLIRPALARGDWVICDRFADSTRVYQGTLGGVPAAELEALIAFSTGGQAPDLTFILDCPVELALSRVKERGVGHATEPGVGTVDRYDLATAAVHERMRAGYLQLLAAHPERCIRIDAAQSPEQMLSAAKVALEGRFGKH
ncbi:MAG: dTMP kinase [Proteobacteria bacterium]|nr:dTMP kinase [Pseudomonadota bacterium]